MKYVIATIATEALVQLFFEAAPIQWLRNILIRITPYLYSKSRDEHLFECKYCTSVWFAFIVFFTYDYLYYLYAFIAIHRLSNYMHLIFGIIRDKQLDIRIKRR